MTNEITESVAQRLADLNATAKPEDLYSRSGADFYERLVGADRSEVREVLTLARNVTGEILDIAAGSGRLTIPLIRLGRTVTAVDLSSDMLAILQQAVPDSPALDCVVADMRTFDLGRRFGLAVIGATSITLLGEEGRREFYANVRAHLSDDGIFALTIAGEFSGAALRQTEDRIVAVDGTEGLEDYLYSQQMIEGGAARLINWVQVSALTEGTDVPVLTSCLQVVSEETLVSELIEAGFEAPTVQPVRSYAGADIVLLTTSPVADSSAR